MQQCLIPASWDTFESHTGFNSKVTLEVKGHIEVKGYSWGQDASQQQPCQCCPSCTCTREVTKGQGYTLQNIEAFNSAKMIWYVLDNTTFKRTKTWLPASNVYILGGLLPVCFCKIWQQNKLSTFSWLILFWSWFYHFCCLVYQCLKKTSARWRLSYEQGEGCRKK